MQNCPDCIQSEEEAQQFFHEAQNLRAGRKKDKDACYARLRQALLDAQNADTRLFEADIYIGRLRYITRRSGFTIPSYSTRHRDPPSPVLIQHEDEELDSLSGSITIIAD